MNQIAVSIRLIFLFILFCVKSHAQNNTFNNALIIKHDGTQIECLARYPDMSDSKAIRYKLDKNSKTQRMKSNDIKTVRYLLRNNKVIEIEYHRYVSFFEMRGTGRKNVFAPEWLEVLVRGHLMLYVIEEIPLNSGRQRKTKSIQYHYYCKKENEEFASEIAYVLYKSGFLIYRMEEGDYFTNAPDIAKKIENREEGYTAKDIISIVEEYNSFWKTFE